MCLNNEPSQNNYLSSLAYAEGKAFGIIKVVIGKITVSVLVTIGLGLHGVK
jgi:hypothetical protein